VPESHCGLVAHPGGAVAVTRVGGPLGGEFSQAHGQGADLVLVGTRLSPDRAQPLAQRGEFVQHLPVVDADGALYGVQLAVEPSGHGFGVVRLVLALFGGEPGPLGLLSGPVRFTTCREQGGVLVDPSVRRGPEGVHGGHDGGERVPLGGQAVFGCRRGQRAQGAVHALLALRQAVQRPPNHAVGAGDR
jgi:hypothetical protein